MDLRLDEFLKRNIRVDYLTCSVIKFFYVFESLVNILNTNLKTVLHKALVRCFFSCGIAFWGGAFHIHIILIIRVCLHN